MADLAFLLNVSSDTIYRMRDNGELPPKIEMNRRLNRWQVADIELWFELDCPGEKDFKRYKNDLKRFARKKKSR